MANITAFYVIILTRLNTLNHQNKIDVVAQSEQILTIVNRYKEKLRM